MGEAEDIRDRIRGYFERRYYGLGCGRMVSFGEYCIGTEMEAEEKKYSSELERAKAMGLCYRDYRFSLDFIRVIVKCGRAWVKLKERHRVVFELTRDTVSAMGGMLHTLRLRKTGNRWYITSHRYRDEMGEGPPGRWPVLRPSLDWCHPMLHKDHPPVLRVDQYNRSAALEYAHRWALGRNPKYYDFENLGGDCTNFCSQVLHAGGCPMNNTKGTGWYYYSLNNRSPSWTGVEFFYRFVIGNRGTGPRGQEVSPSDIDLGDVIQLDFSHDDAFNHCLIVVANPEPGNINRILISCHTVDRDNYPLVFYNWRGIRYIHITGCGRQLRQIQR
ncbi:MAG TPA: amidase domain-containing protein [Bacillota bacterium]|jgi:hypothetical protein|nr:amidase domain-containing protein [Bacillota bacterium]